MAKIRIELVTSDADPTTPTRASVEIVKDDGKPVIKGEATLFDIPGVLKTVKDLTGLVPNAPS